RSDFRRSCSPYLADEAYPRPAFTIRLYFAAARFAAVNEPSAAGVIRIGAPFPEPASRSKIKVDVNIPSGSGGLAGSALTVPFKVTATPAFKTTSETSRSFTAIVVA